MGPNAVAISGKWGLMPRTISLKPEFQVNGYLTLRRVEEHKRAGVLVPSA